MDGVEAAAACVKWEALIVPDSTGARSAGYMVDLTVVIVSYNVKPYLALALRTALMACRSISAEIIVVDNASIDGSADMVEEEFIPGATKEQSGQRGSTEIRLIRGARNIGFAAGNNLGIREAEGRYVLLLNPDVVVHQKAFEVLVRYMDDHLDVGASSGRITNPDGTNDPGGRRGAPSPSAAFYHMVGLSYIFPRSRRFARYKLTYLDENQVAEVESLSGCFMCVRRRAIDQIGMLDESFFMYGEDLDWCYRIRSGGWKIVSHPEAEIVHFRGESTRSLPKIRQLYEFHRAMRIFVHKHLSSKRSGVMIALIELGIVIRGVGVYLWRLFQATLDPLLDLALLALALVTALGLRTLSGWVVPPFSLQEWLLTGTVFIASGTIGALLTKLYEHGRPNVLRALTASAIGGALCVVAIFFIKTINFSRIVTGLIWLLAATFIAGWRCLLQQRSRQPQNRVLVLGCGEKARAFLQTLASPATLETDEPHHYHVIGVIRGSDDAPGCASVEQYPVLGDLNDLPLLLRRLEVDELFVAWEHYKYSDILALTRRGYGPRRIRLIPDGLPTGEPQTPEQWPLINLDKHS